MAVIVADFDEPVIGPDGVACRARACGLSRPGGRWQGWIEFNPLNGEPTFRSPYETTQASGHELRQWASGLTCRSLEDALVRALDRLRPCFDEALRRQAGQPETAFNPRPPA